ncbi:MAG: TIGR03435 family protein [Acidobacteria bacterium]|nr:TIGR03435 family protein [Acidobacteriota bacterium]
MESVSDGLVAVFNWIAQTSIYAAVIIVVIAAVQRLVRHRLPARWSYALWMVLLVRLLLPASIESDFSAWNLVPQITGGFKTDKSAWEERVGNTALTGRKDNLTGIAPDAPLVTPHNNTVVPTGGENDGGRIGKGNLITAAVSQRGWRLASGVWLAGAVILMLCIMARNLRLWLSVRRLRSVTEQWVLELFEDCRQHLQLRTTVGLFVTDKVKSPSLFGFIRPRVLLPADLIGHVDREELQCIFLHELAHLKRGDIWINWIVALLQSLHWFNPLVWWAFIRMRAGRESACDALVLSYMRGEEADRYGRALINLLERFNQSQHLPAVAGIFESKEQLKWRLTMIAKFKRPTRAASIFAAALLVILSCCLLTDAKDNPVPLTPEQVMAQDALDNKMEEGKRIFERSLEAQGGRARFSQIKDMTFSANMKILSQSVEMDVITYLKGPRKLRQEIRVGGAVNITLAFNGKSGWMTDPNTGTIQDMPDPVLEQLKNSALGTQIMFDPQMLYMAAGFEGRELIDGREYLVIKHTGVLGFDSVLIHMDPDTYLPYKFTMRTVDYTVEMIALDYRDTEGMKFPFIINMNLDNTENINMVFSEWIFNSDLEDSFFERPAVAEIKHSSDEAPGPGPLFDEVSIKPTQDCSRPTFSVQPGRYIHTCVSLSSLIMNAYAIQPYQLVGGPSWVRTSRFDIEAKSSAADFPGFQHRLRRRMLESMLAERFHLKMHRETREAPAYELVVAEGGHKLPAAKDERGNPIVDVPRNDFMSTSSEQKQPGPGECLMYTPEYQCKAVTIQDPLSGLSLVLGRPVIDKTGLTGRYDFILKWESNNTQSVITAVREQLGLELELATGQGEFFIIDSAEKPSEN